MTSRPSENIRRPHPLAAELAERLRPGDARVLEIGAGSGRNTDALRRAGLNVHSISDAGAHSIDVPSATFDAAISTHAFLHGTPAIIQRMLAATALALKTGAPFYCTFASKRDARFGKGTRIDDDTYAPASGDETGVAHVYFDEPALRHALAGIFSVESLTEEHVDEVVGSWAHENRPYGCVHWFLRAHRNSDLHLQ